MRVGVGSTNPVKRSATESAFAAWAATAESTVVESVAVASGVSEQPVGERETVAGAVNRARNVLDPGEDGRANDHDRANDDDGRANHYDLGVGLEGGVAEVEAADGLYLIMWAAATDGDRLGRGAGPRLRLPDSIAARVRDGEELGPVMNDVLGTDDVAENQGAAGALTGGIVDRESALRSAVAGALGPFVTELYE